MSANHSYSTVTGNLYHSPTKSAFFRPRLKVTYPVSGNKCSKAHAIHLFVLLSHKPSPSVLLSILPPTPTQPQYFPLFRLFFGGSLMLYLGFDCFGVELIPSTGPPITLCLIHVCVFLRDCEFLEERVHNISLTV